MGRLHFLTLFVFSCPNRVHPRVCRARAVHWRIMEWMDWTEKSIRISNQAKPEALVPARLVAVRVPRLQKCLPERVLRPIRLPANNLLLHQASPPPLWRPLLPRPPLLPQPQAPPPPPPPLLLCLMVSRPAMELQTKRKGAAHPVLLFRLLALVQDRSTRQESNRTTCLPWSNWNPISIRLAAVLRRTKTSKAARLRSCRRPCEKRKRPPQRKRAKRLGWASKKRCPSRPRPNCRHRRHLRAHLHWTCQSPRPMLPMRPSGMPTAVPHLGLACTRRLSWCRRLIPASSGPTPHWNPIQPTLLRTRYSPGPLLLLRMPAVPR